MRTMRKRLWVQFLAGLLLPAGLAFAGSPARSTVSVAAGTTNSVGTGSWTLSYGAGIGFRTESVVMPATAGTTQTVYFVFSGVTNSMGTKAVAASDYLLPLTNAPWLFDGDGVVISTTATNGYTGQVIGEMQR